MIKKLLIILLANLLLAYCLPIILLDKIDHSHNNLNRLYTAGLSSSLFIIIELWSSSEQSYTYEPNFYKTRPIKIILTLLCFLLGIFFILAIKYQWFVTDIQFLKSMIENHGQSLVLCEPMNKKLKEKQEERQTLTDLDKQTLLLTDSVMILQQNRINQMTKMIK